MKKIFLFLSVLFILASCTITERVAFNSKMGGTISYEIDATEFSSFMSSLDSTGKGFNLGDSLSELEMSTIGLKNVKGISDVGFTKDANKVTLNFSFADIEALNSAHVELGIKNRNAQSSTYKKAEQKSKKELIYRTWPLGQSAEDSVYASIGLMFTYKLEASFPKSISGTSGKTINVNDKNISWTSSVEDPGAVYAFDGISIKLK